MKAIKFLLAALMVVSCTNPQNGLGMGQNMAANLLNNHCQGYVESQQLWQIAKMTLGNQLNTYRQKICQCAAEESVRQMSSSQMLALADESQRTQVLVSLLAPTVQVCYGKLQGLFQMPLARN